MPIISSSDRRTSKLLSKLILALIVGTAAGGLQAGERRVVDARAPGLFEHARAVPLGAALRLENLHLDRLGTVALDLRRIRVFSREARIHYGSASSAAPQTIYFRGTVDGFPGSIAVVSFRDRAAFGGLVWLDGSSWLLRSPGGRPAGREMDASAPSSATPFSCHVEEEIEARGNSLAIASTPFDAPPNGGGGGGAPPPFSHTARVAVETDWEFLQLFGGDTAAATDYIGTMFAFASSVYIDEIDTSLEVTYVEFWPGTAEDDPWTEGDYNGNGVVNCSDRLTEFRDYWRANRTGVERTVAHMLSGKQTGCGGSFVGVLCSSTAGFGFSGSLVGSFDPADPSLPVWDIVVVTHEIGHNFNSPHTHCYNSVPDSSYPDPVDTCATASGCYSGATALPQGCPGSGQGCGTIMSYCHLKTGGYGNISMTFGGSVRDGSRYLYGVLPERVPRRMHDHVLSKAATGCLDPILPGPILSVSQNGDGSGRTTSLPGGIDCGTDCSEEYASGTLVTLEAIPDFGSTFVAWAGDADCVDGAVTMNSDVDCMATFGMIDRDGDTVGAAEDCNDTDASAWAIPTIVAGVAVEIVSTVTRLFWGGQSETAGPGTVYDVVSGSLSELRGSGGYNGATCLAADIPNPVFDDPRADGAAGAGVYYLMRAGNVCGSKGYGDSSMAADPRDTLDSAGPCP